MTTTNQAGPGWYPDPSNPQQLRWYDGTQWTDSVHAGQQQAPQQQQPPQYAAPGYAAPSYTAPQYGNQPASGPSNGCQICGATPALAVKLRGHQGMLLVMRFLSYPGQFCRDCGTAKFREVQSRTMLVGWWGYFSFVANTYNVFHNMNIERKLRALGAPQGRVRPPKPLPPTVFKTPGFAVTLCLPLLILVLITQVYT